MKKFQYSYLFGPVPSRRLGISLGVDLVQYKTCSLNCLYCESGKTTRLTAERKEYVPTKDVLDELNRFLSERPKLDYITFSGSGEPTLHSGIGKIVGFLKANFPRYKIALLSNGTLFHLPGLIEEVKDIDLLIPSLDAAEEAVFKKLNRPTPGLNVDVMIESLETLRKNTAGQMWLEIFIVPGVNDSERSLESLKSAVHKIKPDLVQLNTLDRPGTEDWLDSASPTGLEKIAKYLDWHCEIIAKFSLAKNAGKQDTDVESAILQMIKRRPCTANDLSASLGIRIVEVNKYIRKLLEKAAIESQQMDRGEFYKLAEKEIRE